MLTSLDFLYIALGVGFIFLVILLSVLLIHLVLVLRDVRKVSNTAGTISEYFQEIVTTPLYYVGKISQLLGPHLETIIKSKINNAKDKKKK